MYTADVKINLYHFDELNEKSKEKAIQEHRDFMLSTTYDDDFEFEGDYESTLEEIEENDDYVIENIKANDYIFFENGKLADCVTYCGGHPKSGITEFNFMGSIYQIQ